MLCFNFWCFGETMSNDYKIVGFMPSRDLYSQGYPFIEAIYSALHVVDKLYIIDNSSDSTADIYKKLYTPRVSIIFKDWKFTNKNTKNGEVIAEVSNYLLKQIKNDYKQNTYIFYIQANEVIHEDTYELLREIPKIFPNYKGYLLDYYELFNTYLYGEQYRLRFAPLSNNIVVDGDGWAMRSLGGFWASFVEFLSTQYYTFIKYQKFNDGFMQIYSKYRFVYTTKPIFRYSRIFIDNTIEKLKIHNKLFSSLKFDYQLRKLKSELYSKGKTSKNSKFWLNLINISRMTDTSRREFPNLKLNLIEHPKIMQPILNKKRYFVRKNLIEKINNL